MRGRQVLLHSIEPLADVRVGRRQVLLRPGDIHAGAHEQAAELVVQLARQACLFPLGDALQMRGELDELAGALLDLVLQPVLLQPQLLGLRARRCRY